MEGCEGKKRRGPLLEASPMFVPEGQCPSGNARPAETVTSCCSFWLN